MDPLTHTLLGLALAESGLRDRSRFATVALVVGANLPDIDALLYVTGDRDLGLLCRRGWTHGVLALALWPFLLTAALLAWERLRPPRAGGPPARPLALLGLSALAIFSHPTLDWLNTYGMRWLMPFDGRWFYGDALFIIDPWVWLALGGGVLLARPRSRWSLTRWATLGVLASAMILAGPRIAPAGARALWLAGIAALVAARWLVTAPAPRFARAAVTGFALYAAAMVAASRVTGRAVRATLASHPEGPPGEIMVGPTPANPFAWDVIAAFPSRYGFFRVDWWRSGLQPIPAGGVERGPQDERVRAALAARSVRGLVGWSRFPWYEVEPDADGWSVHIRDARFSRSGRGGGIGAGEVRLDRELRLRDP